MSNKQTAPSSIVHDTPMPAQRSDEFWGSDAIAGVLRDLQTEYVALNPGASYRGLHDSIVNYLGNRAPQMLLTIHDEHAVSIAHGYWKASERMMAAALHSNVGLMHASMQIFNCWCDRAPVLIIGATGPWDAAKRRPWIDWIHTCSDQGGMIRNYTKWDNQPGSVPAAMEAILRAAQIAQTAPRGPVYVNLDSAVQEAKISALPPTPEVSRYRAPEPAQPARELVVATAKILSAAKNPVVLAGRSSRSLDAWNARIALAEKLSSPVLTNLKVAAAFPTDHRLHVTPPFVRLSSEAQKLVAEADVILSLDWLDLGGTLKQAFGDKPVTAKVIQVSCDAHSHRGWSMDYQGLPPVDFYLMCEADTAVPLLLEAVKARTAAVPSVAPAKPPAAATDAVTLRGVADALNAVIKGIDVCFTRFPLGWHGAYTHFRHPLDYIGYDGGGGLGSGPGISVGAALALKGSGRLPIGLLGDGDFLMGNTAVWTAVHYEIPCLLIICNNGSFFNDEMHQERVARTRHRPVENRWIGQRIGNPDVDIAAIARAQGATGIGPVTHPAEVQPALEKGIEAVGAGGVCVIDARVLPGYDAE
ncbi:MAG: thiamine pyrophosphate-binding protein [Betaproteobacteria bacterium]|nr:thiamine pyrophosphate-binding protein [Betaproteobacteria bacterium]MDH3438191.1 thiamine pyrophosphate-binding protein [Betaproteobacteria bacterium]